MDGTTPTERRTELVNKFKSSADIMVFLLSTTAMGVGLNLVSANFVVMFDCSWNPSHDAQAQDRAYRIGQAKDVKVFRLVSRGTIEEMKYLRQVYKTQLGNETIVGGGSSDRREQSKRLFRGVDGDKARKGELFGAENLLKFKDGTFMNYAATSKISESRKYGVNIHDTDKISERIGEMNTDDLHGVVDDDSDVFELLQDVASCTVLAGSAENNAPSDILFDIDNIGGVSQAVMDAAEHVNVENEAVCDKLHVGNQVSIQGKQSKPSSTLTTETASLKLGKANNTVELWKNCAKELLNGETQSPVGQPPTVPTITEAGRQSSKGVMLKTSEGPARGSTLRKKWSLARNVLIVGQSAETIRRNEARQTTFSIADLPLPQTAKLRGKRKHPS